MKEALPQLFANEVDHFMAAVVEHLFRRLVRVSLVERKKEHAPLCAKPLLLSWRMPTGAETFGRENYPLSAGLGVCT